MADNDSKSQIGSCFLLKLHDAVWRFRVFNEKLCMLDPLVSCLGCSVSGIIIVSVFGLIVMIHDETMWQPWWVDVVE